MKEEPTKLIDKYGSYQMKLLDITVDITREDVIKFCQMCRNSQP